MTTRLFHISDVHFGVEDRAAMAVVERAVEDERPDAVICTGDLTQRAKHREYREAAEWFAALGVPVLLEPGNHDMPYYNPWERFSDPFRRFRRLQERVGGTLHSDDVVFVSLLTTVSAQLRFPWSDGVIKSAALEQTVEQLSRLKNEPRTVIVTAHHPLLGPETGEKNPTIGGDEAFIAIASAGADAVISGHVHIPFDEVRESGGQSMRLIGTGTLSTRLRNGAPPSYRVITCERGGRISTELREIAEVAR
ncbi:metallophosphoesterase family protein [Erythrobacter sp. GH1-10]|uniref:metallophosphoesterase family protein n=1 Tax=Erythrobacter sp. GH1-10 TaxID=3349334 RepID=UPI003877D077